MLQDNSVASGAVLLTLLSTSRLMIAFAQSDVHSPSVIDLAAKFPNPVFLPTTHERQLLRTQIPKSSQPEQRIYSLALHCSHQGTSTRVGAFMQILLQKAR